MSTSCTLYIVYLIPVAAAAGVRKGEIGGTGLAVDAIGVGGVELEPSPPDIVKTCALRGRNGSSNAVATAQLSASCVI